MDSPVPRTLLIALFLAVFASASQAAERVQAAPSDGINPRDTKRGWFFYKDPKQEEPPAEAKPDAPKPPVAVGATPKDPCAEKSTWTPKCGFIDPGQDFEFQAKQRDALMERMALSRNDPKAVEQFQYYMRWVTRQATAVAAMWEYNKVQNPELDPGVTSPVSHLGIQMLRDATSKEAQGIYKVLKQEGAFFVYFSRSDCDYCHAMRSPLQTLADRTGLEVHNASLDDKCMPGYEKRCMSGEGVTGPATALQVSIVPTIFLHVPGHTWIRVATGIVDAGTIAARATNFFAQTRSAMAKTMAAHDEGETGRPAMDFETRLKPGVATGVEGKAGLTVPTTDEIKGLLNRAPAAQ